MGSVSEHKLCPGGAYAYLRPGVLFLIWRAQTSPALGCEGTVTLTLPAVLGGFCDRVPAWVWGHRRLMADPDCVD